MNHNTNQEEPKNKFYKRSDIGQWLKNEPPELKWVFKNNLKQGILAGLMAQGGTGKSYLCFYLAISCATGMKIFDFFQPSGSMKVLCIFGEDAEDIVWRRLKAIIRDLKKQEIKIDEVLLISNLHLFCGQSDPFMKLGDGNPITTDTYERLSMKIDELQPGLVIIDPKSQFFGLEENSNDLNTQWANCLKKLSQINGATILFDHHVTKTNSQTLDQSAARGGGALTDSCRWVANMIKLPIATAKKFGLDNYEDYIEFKLTKSSYTKLHSNSIYFIKLEGGILRQVDLESYRFLTVIDILEGLIEDGSLDDITINQLLNKKDGEVMRVEIKKAAKYKVTKAQIDDAINGGINGGRFCIEEVINTGASKPSKYLRLKHK